MPGMLERGAGDYELRVLGATLAYLRTVRLGARTPPRVQGSTATRPTICGSRSTSCPRAVIESTDMPIILGFADTPAHVEVHGAADRQGATR